MHAITAFKDDVFFKSISLAATDTCTSHAAINRLVPDVYPLRLVRAARERLIPHVAIYVSSVFAYKLL
jgi:hypothetical protein